MIQLINNENNDIDSSNIIYKTRDIILLIDEKYKNNILQVKTCRINLFNYIIQKGVGYNSSSEDIARFTISYYGNIENPFIMRENGITYNLNAKIIFFSNNYTICTDSKKGNLSYNFSDLLLNTNLSCPTYGYSNKNIYIPFPKYYNMDHQLMELDLNLDFNLNAGCHSHEEINLYPLMDLLDKNTKILTVSGNTLNSFYGIIPDIKESNNDYTDTDLFGIASHLYNGIQKLNIREFDLVINTNRCVYNIVKLEINKNSIINKENIKFFNYRFNDFIESWYYAFVATLKYSKELQNKIIFINIGVTKINIRTIDSITKKITNNLDLSIVNEYSMEY